MGPSQPAQSDDHVRPSAPLPGNPKKPDVKDTGLGLVYKVRQGLGLNRFKHFGRHLDVQLFRHAATIIRIGTEEVAQLPHLDLFASTTQSSRDGRGQSIFLLIAKQAV